MTGGGGGGTAAAAAAGCSNNTQIVICKFSQKTRRLRFALATFAKIFFRVRARVFVCVLD
jgi:hypothetical protein